MDGRDDSPGEATFALVLAALAAATRPGPVTGSALPGGAGDGDLLSSPADQPAGPEAPSPPGAGAGDAAPGTTPGAVAGENVSAASLSLPGTGAGDPGEARPPGADAAAPVEQPALGAHDPPGSANRVPGVAAASGGAGETGTGVTHPGRVEATPGPAGRGPGGAVGVEPGPGVRVAGGDVAPSAAVAASAAAGQPAGGVGRGRGEPAPGGPVSGGPAPVERGPVEEARIAGGPAEPVRRGPVEGAGIDAAAPARAALGNAGWAERRSVPVAADHAGASGPGSDTAVPAPPAPVVPETPTGPPGGREAPLPEATGAVPNVAPATLPGRSAAAAGATLETIAPPGPPVTVPVTDQLVAVLEPLRAAPDGTTALTLELRPAELGAVTVEISVESGVVHLALHAEQAGTAELLRHSITDLRVALEAAGLLPGDVGVGRGTAGDRGPAGRRERAGDAGAGGRTRARPDPLAPGAPARRRADGATLDVLL